MPARGAARRYVIHLTEKYSLSLAQEEHNSDTSDHDDEHYDDDDCSDDARTCHEHRAVHRLESSHFTVA